MPEELHAAQVAWFNRTVDARRRRWGGAPIPALVFVHIPMFEYQDALKRDFNCFGTSDDGITPTTSNTGLFAALDSAPEVLAVFVGHDHCNDFCCQFGARAVDLCFGRHSGWGGYDCNGYDKGSRVITFQQQPLRESAALQTHVRMTNGSVIHRGTLV